MQTCSRVRYYVPNAYYLCARVSCVYQQRGGNNARARRSAERERYDGGDINDLSMDNLSLVFLLWCKISLSQIFEKRNAPLTAPLDPRKRPHTRGKRVQQVVKHQEHHRENKKNRRTKKEKKKENHTRTLFLLFDIIFHTQHTQTHEFFTTKRLFDFVL